MFRRPMTNEIPTRELAIKDKNMKQKKHTFLMRKEDQTIADDKYNLKANDFSITMDNRNLIRINIGENWRFLINRDFRL